MKMVGNLTLNNSLEDFDAKDMYLHLKNRSVLLQKHWEIFCFHHFRAFTRYHFQNVPVRVPFPKYTVFKSAGKNVPFSCEQEAYPSHISPFSNVLASCERSLDLSQDYGKIVFG